MKKIIYGAFLLLIGLSPVNMVFSGTSTLFETSNYTKLPTSSEIDNFLSQLSTTYSTVHYKALGKSSGGRPMGILLISRNKHFLDDRFRDPNRLTVFLVGSMHATEWSGCEALQKFILDLLQEPLAEFLDSMNFVILVNANPDGRDLKSRFNQQSGNINADFINLNYKESQHIVTVLHDYRPDVVLDLHQSSVIKQTLTHLQGYVHSYEAQYDYANNLNINPQLRQLTAEVLLPEWMAETKSNGLNANHYGGEITRLNQPVTHGGLGLSNLRNYAGLQGMVSFLVESRLDSEKNGKGKKVELLNQYKALVSFIKTIEKYKKEIKQATAMAQSDSAPDKSLFWQFGYSLNVKRPIKQLILKQYKTNKIESVPFPNHDTVSSYYSSLMPEAYAIVDDQNQLKEVLKRHYIVFETLNSPRSVIALLPLIEEVHIRYPQNVLFNSRLEVKGSFIVQKTELPKEALIITTAQPLGVLAAMLLDYRSMNSYYQNKSFREKLFGKPYLSIFPIVQE